MVKSFVDRVTEKIFMGEELTSKEKRAYGDLKVDKAQRALTFLDKATEKELLTSPFYYHSLHGTDRYSIDVNGRRSKWRATFRWENGEKKDVEMVLIEVTHR